MVSGRACFVFAKPPRRARATTYYLVAASRFFEPTPLGEIKYVTAVFFFFMNRMGMHTPRTGIPVALLYSPTKYHS